MQGDPFIQDPMNLQNYNRYAYCYNNPMTCTDPSGYLFGGMFNVPFIDNAWNNHIKKYAPVIAAVVISVYLPGSNFLIGLGAEGAVAQAAVTGFISGTVATGNVKGGLQGAFTAGMFAGAGNVIAGGNFLTGASEAAAWSGAAGIALHGVVGCATSSATGGSCGSGALSAAFTKALASTEFMKSVTESGNKLSGAAISAAAGGSASILGGGKFANGAVTGAFSYLFNDSLHNEFCRESVCDRFESLKTSPIGKLYNYIFGERVGVPVNATYGYGGTAFAGVVGYSADAGIALDSTRNACLYINSCTAVGMGATIGHGNVIAAGTGALTSSKTEYTGAFWTGGNGLLGSGQYLKDNSGNGVVGRGFGGVGVGAAAGGLVCTMQTKCIRN
ncbi:hypothetical protein GYK42_28635 [Janthinobacterium lividum]|nr:hypothetical protein [Janthinobacterium lividum]